MTGAELDYWVAKAQGESPYIEDDKCMISWNAGDLGGNETHRAYFQPSVDWQLAGQIIEREDLLIAKMNDLWYSIHPDMGDTGYWAAGYVDIYADGCGWKFGKGETPLIAAMRAYVTNKYGETVPADTNEPDQ
nr:phage protein NinX family protein [Alcaligenes faecalis]